MTGTSASGGGAEKDDVVREPVERLLEDSIHLFGHPHFVLAGALVHAKLDGRKTLSRDEAEKAIKNYLKHEEES